MEIFQWYRRQADLKFNHNFSNTASQVRFA